MRKNGQIHILVDADLGQVIVKVLHFDKAQPSKLTISYTETVFCIIMSFKSSHVVQ